MNLQEYSGYDSLGLSELLRDKEVTARELSVLAVQARNKVNPSLNAVVEIYEERIDKPDPGADRGGDFYGVPFLVKDLALMEAGKRMEAGSRLCEGMISPVDSELMRRYKKAGFNNIGRTNCPEFGFSCSTESVFRERTSNPWDLGKSSGGSSGGAAAAVASGIVPAAHASDAGGSIRCPASCCGVFGLKPTRGRISHAPGGDGFNGLANDHVLSRSVRDSAAILDLTQGYLSGDPYRVAAPNELYLNDCAKDPDGLKIAFCKSPNGPYSLDEEVEAFVDEAAKLCEHLGHEVVEAGPVWDEELFINCSADIWAANCASTVNMISAITARDVNEDALEKVTFESYEYGSQMLGAVFVHALSGANLISRQVTPFFDSYNVLLTPTLLIPPFEHGTYLMNDFLGGVRDWFEKMAEVGNFLSVFNMTGQPAMSVPLFENREGLPVGIQFVAGFGREDILFQLAGQLEREKPWASRLPIIHSAH